MDFKPKKHPLLAFCKKASVFFWAVWLVPFVALAQDDEDANTDYETEFNYGLNFYTQGGLIGGISLKYAKERKPGWYNRFQLEIVNLKHPKEFHSRGAVSSYIPNKYQYLFAVRPSFGQEYRLFRKAPEEGVQLNAIVAGGPTIGVTKPYYVLFQDSTGDNAAVSVPYNPSISQGDIVGVGSPTDGFDHLGIVPGFHMRAGLSFESGKMRSSVFGLEGGFITEFYTRQIELLKFNANGAPGQAVKNPSAFYAFYLILYYGTKH